MNQHWDKGYQGIEFNLCFGKRTCWKSTINNRCCQLSLGWVQLSIYFYDKTALICDYVRAERDSDGK